MSPYISADPAKAFDRLHRGVQRWVWEQGWDRLRTVQALAVDPILAGRDLVIAAATASGKTEAAWLPICSAIAADPPLHTSNRLTDAGMGDSRGLPRAGVRALYIGPLKALINDQYLRLEPLGESTRLPVHRWHGDVAGNTKKNLLRNPDGILLITPESLEALFVREGPRIAALFAALRFIVIDELHSFIGTERGAQLQSLMHRLDLAVRRRVPRVGLSATLADLGIAAEFLRPGRASSVHLLDNPADDSAEIRIQLRGYTKTDVDPSKPRGRPEDAARAGISTDDLDDMDAAHASDALVIGAHLYKTLRGRDNLVFANSRAFVEAYSDILTKLCEQNRVPNEFFPHHGNLSKEYREDVEDKLRSSETPATAICTSTLEMGIDIGSTDAVAQIGAPGSVAALRQRLGRSGRRNQPAVLRLYVSETEITERTPPADQVRAQLVQTIAMTNLMLHEHWYEPPNTNDLHLSTLTQQILSVIAQHGGATAQDLYVTLCGAGPFSHINKTTFVRLLRELGNQELLTQASDGLLLHGRVGDKLVNHYSFYTAFQTAEEYRLTVRGRTLGSIPVDYPLLVGSRLIFAGRRWKVLDVDPTARVVELTRSSGGRPPAFSGGGAEVADLVRQRMRNLYESDVIPVYLNAHAQDLLDEARIAYRRLRLDRRPLVDWGKDTLLFCWRGDRILNTIAVTLAAAGLKVGIEGVALVVNDAKVDDVLAVTRTITEQPPPEAADLANGVPNKLRDKYDEYLSDDLLSLAYAARSLDIEGARQTLDALARYRPDPGDDGAALGANYANPTALSLGSTLIPRPKPRLGETRFAVVDLETTGFAAHDDDRVVELAVVLVSEDGHVTGRWETLVNPGREPGPSHVHGLTAEDFVDAPHFSELTDWLSALLAGRVVVAHNALFDMAFLTAEYERADIDTPGWATLCTLEMAGRIELTDARSLKDCCAAVGITQEAAHTALGDAEATAQLLRHCLQIAADRRIDQLSELGCNGSLPVTALAATPPPTPRLRARSVRRTIVPSPLSQLIAKAPTRRSDNPAANAYLSMLDSVVANTEAANVDALRVAAHGLGIDISHRQRLHTDYIASLLEAQPDEEQRMLIAQLQGLLAEH